MRKTSVVVLGGVMGVLIGGEGGLADAGVAWVGLAAGGFVLGLFVGHHVWRPAAVAVVSVITGLAAWGVIR